MDKDSVQPQDFVVSWKEMGKFSICAMYQEL